MISKKIYYIWLGNKKIPDYQKKCIASWSKFCPDYEIICINESTYDINSNAEAKRWYDLGVWAFAASAIRFDILSHNSGFYLDTDIELIKPLDQLMCMPSFLVKTGGAYILNNAFLGSNADDMSIFKTCLESVQRAYIDKLPPAKALNAPLLKMHPSIKSRCETEVFNDCAYLSQDMIILPSMTQSKDTYGIHYAATSWKNYLSVYNRNN